MNTGDFLLYVSVIAGVLSAALIVKGVEKYARPCIALLAASLTTAFLLLAYYFVFSNFGISYVWSYSSRELPLFYKLSGVLAGQQGTLLFWGVLVSLFTLWIAERGGFSAGMRKAQVIAIAIALCFVVLTALDSPFKTIYEAYGLPETRAVPEDGAGLNPLLIDPWMAAHPPFMFLAYAAMALPFALAIVYLFESARENGKAVYREWVASATTWCRISWLFLTLGVALGGFWSYKVLGWGGFWAWDPVETSSLVPWLLLTGTLHALAEHRASEQRYAVLAPTLTALSFVLVLYATLVTRSGFFESIHAFGSGEVGKYLVAMIIASTLATIALAANKYLRSEERSEKEASFVNRTNIFYAAILLFCILTFVSFWGITFPALVKLFTGNKYGVTSSFFNIWSYPFFIALMLLAALGLNYKPAERERSLRMFAAFTALTIIAAFIKPSGAFHLLDYSAIVTAEKPRFYEFIGSISALSFLPPSLYLLLSSYERAAEKLKAPQAAKRIKGVGVVAVHVGVVFIALGAVFSTLLASEFSVSVAQEQELAVADGTHYAVKLLSYDVYSKFGRETALPANTLSVGEFYSKADALSEEDFVMVRGLAEDVRDFGNFRAVELSGDGRTLFVVTSAENIPTNVELVAGGYIHKIAATNASTRESLLLAEQITTAKKLLETVQEARIAVYQDSSRIGEGTAKVINYGTGDNKRVMIDRGIFRDVYVIFTGIEGSSMPLTVKLIPFVNYLWTGIVLFALGVLAILAGTYIKGNKK